MELNYNNVWGNGLADYNNVSAGPNDISANPLFAGPAFGDFHLKSTSPCIDAGTDVGIMVDIDGHARPAADGFDIGADEAISEGTTWTTASVAGAGDKAASGWLNLLVLLGVPLGALIILRFRINH